jgi:hypothetical protein
MKRFLSFVMGLGLLLVSAHALADVEQFCDPVPEGVRELAGQLRPGVDMIDCIVLKDTPLGDYCLALYPWNLNGFMYADGVWKNRAEEQPIRHRAGMRLYFRRHEEGASPDMQGACGLTYPDNLGFDLIQTDPGDQNSVVMMLQFHWSGEHLRLVGWQKGAAGQFAIWEDGLWAYFDSETGERLGSARIDRLAEYGLMARAEDLPHTLEAAQKMETITRVTAETLFPGWTMAYYGEYNMGRDANAGYYRIENGMLTIRRIRLSAEAGGVVLQTDCMPVPLSETLLARLRAEDVHNLLYTNSDSIKFRTDDAFDRTRIPVMDTILQNNLQTHGLLLLTEDADGVRRIRWVERDGDGYSVRSSKPLPGDAQLDLFHIVDDEVSLEWNAHHGSCSFSRSADGNWTLGWVANEHGFVDMYGTLYCGIQQYLNKSSTDSILVGSHPWRDMFTVDMTSLPHSVEEAVAGLDRDGWAVVCNPNPADRLHLRAEPNAESQSLGEFYNRTPVQVMVQQGGWTRVRIGLDGRLEGWMMTEFLAFGSAMDAVDSASPELNLGESYLNRPLFASVDMRETTNVPFDYGTWIVGVVGDELYILLDSDGNTGYLPQSWFFKGNG